jgi:hypothetical protein
MLLRLFNWGMAQFLLTISIKNDDAAIHTMVQYLENNVNMFLRTINNSLVKLMQFNNVIRLTKSKAVISKAHWNIHEN